MKPRTAIEETIRRLDSLVASRRRLLSDDDEMPHSSTIVGLRMFGLAADPLGLATFLTAYDTRHHSTSDFDGLLPKLSELVDRITLIVSRCETLEELVKESVACEEIDELGEYWDRIIAWMRANP